ncbi:MAG: helix-turn-helix transcriptional regulator [Candidatus Gastranaerophilales bacterium]|nr:helix-turn-helix transcriptional regulator [Candidatus Gastranaerophilales bacterium]
MAGNKDFGKHLKKLRELKGYSQEQLAEIVGLEYQTISRIETGLYFTGFENLEKFSKALDIPIKDLFDFSTEKLSKKDLINIITKSLNNFETNDLINIKKIIDIYQEK